jgi:hypothetical protein
MAQHGTMFVSHDNYVSLDIISTRHKTYLTRGGGLLQLWRVWADNLERKESMLPYIVAVACFRFKGLPAINIAVRVNRVHYMYPRCEEGWLKQDCLNGLLKSNVIGWISLKNQTVIKRFLAKSVKDGQFQIVLNVMPILYRSVKISNCWPNRRRTSSSNLNGTGKCWHILDRRTTHFNSCSVSTPPNA